MDATPASTTPILGALFRETESLIARRGGSAITRCDADDVARGVLGYARRIGLTVSNQVAAINYALRGSADTLQAVREGKARARRLLSMQRGEQVVA